MSKIHYSLLVKEENNNQLYLFQTFLTRREAKNFLNHWKFDKKIVEWIKVVKIKNYDQLK